MDAISPIITCTRRLQFCAGHRVMNHESKCANPHGHNYVVFITAIAPHLDAIGRVIDFSVLKEKVGGWIEEHWDHTFICFKDDMELMALLSAAPGRNKNIWTSPFNPTAEEMARYLLERVCPDVLQDTGVVVTKVVVHETENCYAEASLDG